MEATRTHADITAFAQQSASPVTTPKLRDRKPSPSHLERDGFDTTSVYNELNQSPLASSYFECSAIHTERNGGEAYRRVDCEPLNTNTTNDFTTQKYSSIESYGPQDSDMIGSEELELPARAAASKVVHGDSDMLDLKTVADGKGIGESPSNFFVQYSRINEKWQAERRPSEIKQIPSATDINDLSSVFLQGTGNGSFSRFAFSTTDYLNLTADNLEDRKRSVLLSSERTIDGCMNPPLIKTPSCSFSYTDEHPPPLPATRSTGTGINAISRSSHREAPNVYALPKPDVNLVEQGKDFFGAAFGAATNALQAVGEILQANNEYNVNTYKSYSRFPTYNKQLRDTPKSTIGLATPSNSKSYWAQPERPSATSIMRRKISPSGSPVSAIPTSRTIPAKQLPSSSSLIKLESSILVLDNAGSGSETEMSHFEVNSPPKISSGSRVNPGSHVMNLPGAPSPKSSASSSSSRTLTNAPLPLKGSLSSDASQTVATFSASVASPIWGGSPVQAVSPVKKHVSPQQYVNLKTAVSAPFRELPTNASYEVSALGYVAGKTVSCTTEFVDRPSRIGAMSTFNPPAAVKGREPPTNGKSPEATLLSSRNDRKQETFPKRNPPSKQRPVPAHALGPTKASTPKRIPSNMLEATLPQREKDSPSPPTQIGTQLQQQAQQKETNITIPRQSTKIQGANTSRIMPNAAMVCVGKNDGQVAPLPSKIKDAPQTIKEPDSAQVQVSPTQLGSVLEDPAANPATSEELDKSSQIFPGAHMMPRPNNMETQARFKEEQRPARGKEQFSSVEKLSSQGQVQNLAVCEECKEQETNSTYGEEDCVDDACYNLLEGYIELDGKKAKKLVVAVDEQCDEVAEKWVEQNWAQLKSCSALEVPCGSIGTVFNRQGAKPVALLAVRKDAAISRLTRFLKKVELEADVLPTAFAESWNTILSAKQ